MIVIIHLQRGIPSKRKSLACIDYVPALCTHRPSLLPIERFDEPQGLLLSVGFPSVGLWELMWIYSLRGSKSRNKVSVGEPAEGSLTLYPLINQSRTVVVFGVGTIGYVVRNKETTVFRDWGIFSSRLRSTIPNWGLSSVWGHTSARWSPRLF